MKDFKHYGIVVGRKCRYSLGFGCWASFRECYVKDTGGRVVWEVSWLFWVVEGDALLTQYDRSIIPFLFPDLFCQEACLLLRSPTSITESCWVKMESRSERGSTDVGGRYAETKSNRL